MHERGAFPGRSRSSDVFSLLVLGFSLLSLSLFSLPPSRGDLSLLLSTGHRPRRRYEDTPPALIIPINLKTKNLNAHVQLRANRSSPPENRYTTFALLHIFNAAIPKEVRTFVALGPL